MRTSPVNHSGLPLAEAWEPLRLISNLLLLNFRSGCEFRSGCGLFAGAAGKAERFPARDAIDGAHAATNPIAALESRARRVSLCEAVGSLGISWVLIAT